MSTRLDRRAFLRTSAAAAACGVAWPLLAACGGSARPASPSTASPSAATSAAGVTAPAQPTRMASPTSSPASSAASATIAKVGFAVASFNPFNYVVSIASQKPDLGRTFGIELDVVLTTNAPNAVNALVGGSVDVAAGSPDSSWPALDKAPDVKQVMASANGAPYAIFAQPDIKSAADFKGKTLGVSALVGGADLTAIRVMLSDKGLKDGDYTIVQAGSVADRTAAMKAKAIHGLAQIEPQATILRDAGFPEVDNGSRYPALSNVHPVVVLARKSWYDGSPEVAANFVRLWDAVTTWFYDPANKNEILAITKKTMGADEKSALNAYEQTVQSRGLPRDLHIRPDYMRQFVDNLKKAGALNLPSDPMTYVDNRLVDKSLSSFR